MKRISLNQRYLDQLRGYDWVALTKNLVEYTCRLCHLSADRVIANGMTPVDVAAEAIRKTWSEDRPWDSEKCPELYAHLAGSARSIVSNLRKKNDLSFTLDCSPDEDGNGDGLNCVESTEPEPIDQLIDERDEASAQRGIAEALIGVPDGQVLYEFLAAGTPPREIADLMRRSVAEIYNLTRTIRRRLIAHFNLAAAGDAGSIGDQHGQR